MVRDIDRMTLPSMQECCTYVMVSHRHSLLVNLLQCHASWSKSISLNFWQIHVLNRKNFICLDWPLWQDDVLSPSLQSICAWIHAEKNKNKRKIDIMKSRLYRQSDSWSYSPRLYINIHVLYYKDGETSPVNPFESKHHGFSEEGFFHIEIWITMHLWASRKEVWLQEIEGKRKRHWGK